MSTYFLSVLHSYVIEAVTYKKTVKWLSSKDVEVLGFAAQIVNNLLAGENSFECVYIRFTTICNLICFLLEC